MPTPSVSAPTADADGRRGCELERAPAAETSRRRSDRDGYVTPQQPSSAFQRGQAPPFVAPLRTAERTGPTRRLSKTRDGARGRCPQRDSNPRCGLERAVTWTASRWGQGAPRYRLL